MVSILLKQIVSLVTLLRLVFAQEVTFTGREYAGIFMRSILWDNRQNSLQLRFRTLHENGVLVFSRGKHDKTNYFRLELKKGSLRFSSRLGGNHVTNISLGSDLADGKWHSVRVNPTRRQTQITLDSYPKTELAGDGYNIHSLDGTLFVASFGKQQKRNRFRGCLADVNFDGSNILQEAFKKRFPHITYMGNFIKRCVYDDYGYNLVTFTSPSSFIKVMLPKHSPGENNFLASFQFRTHMKEGLFLSGTALLHEVQLRLESGSLLFSITLSNGHKKISKVGRNLHDGEWHTVHAGLNRTHIAVSVDNRSRTKRINFKDANAREFLHRIRSNVFAGKGFQNKYQGFVGCLFNFTVNDHKIIKRDLDKSKQYGGLRAGVCSIKNRCYPNPCKNGGQCENRYKSIYCNCSTTEFEGNTCEDTIYKQTCAEYRQIGLKDNSHCKLKGKDSKNIYIALCNTTETKNTYTIIAHMGMGRKSVREDVTNNIGYLTHEIEYPVGMHQIEALVQNSEYCRQFVRYDCFSSVLIGPPWSQAHMSWLSRDGKTQTHWGGADPGRHMCACGKVNNCADSYKYCNCDINDDVWRHDEGYFTSKDLLPVTKLQFSKQGFKSYFTLGPLECWGTVQKIVSTSRNDLLSRACNPVPSPTSPPTTKHFRTTEKTTSTRCDAAGSASGYCSLTNEIYLTTTEKQSTKRLFYPRVAAKTESKTKFKRVAGVYENRKRKDPSALEEFRLSLTAIVLISCVLVVFLLVVIRYQLPSVLVCARKLNRRGEATFSMVPPREQMM